MDFDLQTWLLIAAVVLILFAGLQLSRIERGLARINDLLFHIREVKDGALDAIETDRIIDADRKKL